MNKFTVNIIKGYGEQGEQWLEKLPNLVSDLANKWQLQNLQPETNLSFNYILQGTRQDQPVILKIGIDSASVQNEWQALTAFQGYGVVEIFEHDFTNNALLLQCAAPGISLSEAYTVEDPTATVIACIIIDKLHHAPIPVKHTFPNMQDWLKILDHDWQIPQQQLQLARKLKQEVLQTNVAPVLLHGDLHYDNIISNADDWLVIDPKGVIGDPLFDKIGCLLREPLTKLLDNPNTTEIIKARAEQIAHYNKLDVNRIIKWTYVHTVMAICWCIEDNQDPNDMLRFLNMLSLKS